MPLGAAVPEPRLGGSLADVAPTWHPDDVPPREPPSGLPPTGAAPCLHPGCHALSTPLHLTCTEHIKAIPAHIRLGLIESQLCGSRADRLHWLQAALWQLQVIAARMLKDEASEGDAPA